MTLRSTRPRLLLAPPRLLAWSLSALGFSALGLSALSLAVAGCSVHEAPKVEKLLPPLPETWTAPQVPETAQAPETAPTLGTLNRGPELAEMWWRDFGDAQLDALVDEALAQNHDLHAAAARVEQAAAGVRISGADRLPQVNAGVNASRSRNVFVGLPLPGGGVLSSTSTSFGASLNVSWELDLWGRLRAGERAAMAQWNASHAELAAARLSLAAQTTKAWFQALTQRQQVELALRTLDSRKRTAEQVRRRYELGVRPALDVRLSLSQQASAEAALEARQQQLDASLRQLEVLLGRYPSAELRARLEVDEQPRTLPDIVEPVPAGLPFDLLVRRPDLLAAELRLAAAGARVEVARKALYPSLSLTASGGTTSDSVADLLDGNFSVWSLVGNLLQPVFLGGRLRAAVDQNLAAEDEALALYAQSVLGALAEVETQLAAEGLLQRQLQALDEAVEQSRAAEKLAEERYAGGLASYLDVLESQRQALAAESQRIDVQGRRLSTRVDLILALGGGFDFTQAPAAPNPDSSNSSLNSTEETPSGANAS